MRVMMGWAVMTNSSGKPLTNSPKMVSCVLSGGGIQCATLPDSR